MTADPKPVSPRSVPCPRCGADAGAPCVTLRDGRPTGEIHAARYATAQAQSWAEVPGEIGEAMRAAAARRLERSL